jgi:hypothetical protein
MYWVQTNLGDYRKCYKENIRQKLELGLLREDPGIDTIEKVVGVIAVVGYSRLAAESVEQLRQKAPDTIRVLSLDYRVDLKDLY